MLRKTALKHFDQLWDVFDGKLLDAKGSAFLVDPLREFFPESVADDLTVEPAKTRLHENLKKWGEIEQDAHEVEILAEHKFVDGGKLQFTQFKDAEVRWAREFILTAFYNLCCLAANKTTIEELIFASLSDPKSIPMSVESRKAFMKLIAFSNSFLLAEWSQDLIQRAVANSDDEFFKALSRSVKKNTAVDKFPIARTWLGTTLLWYLGGKDLKRREFLALLREKSIVAPALDLPSFNAMLSKLHLIK
jgi:hypothetical protein